MNYTLFLTTQIYTSLKPIFILPICMKTHDRWDTDNDSIFIDFWKMKNAPGGQSLLCTIEFVSNKLYNPPRAEFKFFQRGPKISFNQSRNF